MTMNEEQQGAIDNFARGLELSAKVNLGIARVVSSKSPQEGGEALGDVCNALADLIEASPTAAAAFMRGAASGIARTMVDAARAGAFK
jgi:hypothetical protein